jgi:hypothetical protein
MLLAFFPHRNRRPTDTQRDPVFAGSVSVRLSVRRQRFRSAIDVRVPTTFVMRFFSMNRFTFGSIGFPQTTQMWVFGFRKNIIPLTRCYP